MTNRLAIGIVIGAILLTAAGYLLLRMVFTGGGTQTPTQQSPQVGNVIVPVVVTTTPTASTTTSAGQQPGVIQVASVEEAYQNLIMQLQAEVIRFEEVDAANATFSPVFKLYAADIALAKKRFPKTTKGTLHMASVDLNDDGLAEILVYEDIPGFCGTAGCPFDVYQKKSGQWQQIFAQLSLGEPALANVYTSGYRNLYVSVQAEGYISDIVRYAWSGKTYDPQVAVATWDGTQFSAPQQ